MRVHNVEVMQDREACLVEVMLVSDGFFAMTSNGDRACLRKSRWTVRSL